MKVPYSDMWLHNTVPCPVLPSVAVRVKPLGLCVCILSGTEPGQLVEGPGASLSSEVEAWWEDDDEDDLTVWGWMLPEVVGTTERSGEEKSQVMSQKRTTEKYKYFIGEGSVTGVLLGPTIIEKVPAWTVACVYCRGLAVWKKSRPYKHTSVCTPFAFHISKLIYPLPPKTCKYSNTRCSPILLSLL